MQGDVFLHAAPGILVVGQPLFGRCHLLTGGLEPRFECGQPFRFVDEPMLGIVCAGVELLQRDQPFEISVHMKSTDEHVETAVHWLAGPMCA